MITVSISHWTLDNLKRQEMKARQKLNSVFSVHMNDLCGIYSTALEEGLVVA